MSTITLRIDLMRADPPVRREIRVPGDIPLTVLHWVIQSSMGWEDYHVHGFARGRTYWGSPAVWVADPQEPNEFPEAGTSLAQLLGRARTATYMYDFGDDWEHRLTVTGKDAENIDHVELVGGEGGFALEDCGGIFGRMEIVTLLEALGRGEELTEDEWTRLAIMFGDEPPERARHRLLDFDADAVRKGLNAIPLTGSASFQPVPTVMTVAGVDPTSLAPGLAALAKEMSAWGETAVVDLLAACHLDGIDEPGPEDCEALTADVRWYLDFVGEGLPLTKAGYLRPADVEVVSARVLRDGSWIGKGNREDLTPPVLELREALVALRLLRVAKGRLVPVRKHAALAGEPVALVDHIASLLPLESREYAVRTAFAMMVAELAPADSLSEPEDGVLPRRQAALRRAVDAVGWGGLGAVVPMQNILDSVRRTSAVLDALKVWRHDDASRRELTEPGRRFVARVLRG